MKISIFTPTYNTGARLIRPLLSIMAQTHKDLEWVIYDDLSDDPHTWDVLADLGRRFPWIQVVRGGQHSGVIGFTKRMACQLCSGDLLVELDHDDELEPHALAKLAEAAEALPECGFFYSSDWAILDGKAIHPYGAGFMFGYGEYGGDFSLRANPITPITMRTILASPNHVRAWRANVYREVGGHDRSMPVADDYDLMLRTFMVTRFCRILESLYRQWRGHNTWVNHAGEIRVRCCSLAAEKHREIIERFRALDINDYLAEREITPGNLYEVLNEASKIRPPLEKEAQIDFPAPQTCGKAPAANAEAVDGSEPSPTPQEAPNAKEEVTK